jgi:hypothetical protein
MKKPKTPAAVDDATKNPKTPAVQNTPRAGFSDVDDSGTGSPIKGTKLKFTNDAKWITGTEDVIKPDREFIVISLKRTVQKWVNELPVETIELGEAEGWPDLEQWNDDAPRSEWVVKFGKDTGPWQKCWFAYLLDPKTYEGFTFPTGTAGGAKALSTLKETTGRTRMLQGAQNIFPIVTLADVPMPTQYGTRQRPHFVIKGWQTLGAPAAPPALAKPADAADKKPADKNADINGEINY